MKYMIPSKKSTQSFTMLIAFYQSDFSNEKKKANMMQQNTSKNCKMSKKAALHTFK